MHSNDMSAQLFQGIERIDATLGPVTKIGAYTKVQVTFHSQQCRIGIPVMTHAFPMLVDGNFTSIDASKTINAVPHFQWRFGCYELNAQLFCRIKLLLPCIDCIATSQVN